jgi:hypothetical protein
MEERSGARNVTQRRFDQTAEPAESEKSTPEPPSEAAPPAPTLAPIARDPSDLQLRERQTRWIKERLRFQAQEESSPTEEGPK